MLEHLATFLTLSKAGKRISMAWRLRPVDPSKYDPGVHVKYAALIDFETWVIPTKFPEIFWSLIFLWKLWLGFEWKFVCDESTNKCKTPVWVGLHLFFSNFLNYYVLGLLCLNNVKDGRYKHRAISQLLRIYLKKNLTKINYW
jgi:hypothetical protein